MMLKIAIDYLRNGGDLAGLEEFAADVWKTGGIDFDEERGSAA